MYQKMHLSPDPFVGGVPAVFTIHNLAFQGVFPASTIPQIGLGPEMLHVQAMEHWGQISYLKAGVNFSEKITTVSPGYAREIVPPELGFGLDGVIARRADDLVGILNGIDIDALDSGDRSIRPGVVRANDLSGKREAKGRCSSTPVPVDEASLERPAVGLVSRLTDQKGFDLIAPLCEDLIALDATWVMLGSGEPRYEDAWRALPRRHPGRVSATIGFDERLAHLIEAGADMFLMPSRFEPCGLNQMYSLRYGTVPDRPRDRRARRHGEDSTTQAGRGTGFKFSDYTPARSLAPWPGARCINPAAGATSSMRDAAGPFLGRSARRVCQTVWSAVADRAAEAIYREADLNTR